MLVNSPANMITEAYRVTKPGSRSVFTIWAERENSLQFTCINKIIVQYNPG